VTGATISGAATTIAIDASTLVTGATATLSGVSMIPIVTGLTGTLVATAVTGALNVTTADDAGDTIGITAGTGNLTLTAVAASDTVTIDATAMVGAQTITLAAGASNVTVTNLTSTGLLDASLTTGILTVTGGAGVQSITGGSGADVITGGAGDDIIALGADAAIDTVHFSAVATNGSDIITQFVVANDIINVELLGAGNIAGEAAVAAGATVADAADTQIVYVFADGATATGGETIASYTDLVDVLAFLNAALTIEATDVDGVAVINDLVTHKAYVYNMDVDAAANTVIDSITLVGTITADAALTILNTAFTA